jgi:hypothetical protein
VNPPNTDEREDLGAVATRARASTEAEPRAGAPKLENVPPAGLCPKRFLLAKSSYCGRKLLQGSNYCYWHAHNTNKYAPSAVQSYFGEGVTLAHALTKEIADGGSLESAYLVGAPLGGNWFGPCDLSGGTFVRANLSQAHLSKSNLERANFAYANLEKSRLSDCRITGAQFVGARLFRTKFRNNSFVGVIGLKKENFRGLKWGWLPTYRMLEEFPDQCEGMYRNLANYFSAEGLFDDASWASYRACLMKHRILSKRLSPSYLWASDAVDSAIPEERHGLRRFHFRRFGMRWMVGLWDWFRSLMLRAVMGYGEKPLRVVLNSILAICAYAAIYRVLPVITDRTFLGAVYFSVVTFTTLGYGDLAPQGPFRLIAASEALVGMLLMGLFIFCLGRRSVGRA